MPGFVIIAALAFIGLLMVVHAFAGSRRSACAMLDEYEKLLDVAREERSREAEEEDEKDDEQTSEKPPDAPER